MLISLLIYSGVFIPDVNLACCNVAWEGFLKHFKHYILTRFQTVVITSLRQIIC